MRIKHEWSIKTKRFYTHSVITPMLNEEMPAELLARFAEVASEPQEAKLMAVTAFKDSLRSMVDQWIESGRRDKVEDAWKRNLESAIGEQRPLIEVLSEYRRRNPPQAELGGDGRFDVWMLPVRLASKEPVLRARDMAIYCFISLLDSPTRERFCRCDGCSRYFVRERMPRKDLPIFHGSFCPKCKMKGSARRTRESREARTQKRIGWAADALGQWRPENRFGKEIDWVVKKVNASLKAEGHDPIKTNWVNRHLQAIKAEVDRRKHAKG